MAGPGPVQGRTPRISLPPDNGPGREIIYPSSLRPNLVENISYDMTNFLQVEGSIALAHPADLQTSSVALRYVLLECGREQDFSLRPQLATSTTNKPSQIIQLMITRANQRAPLVTDNFLLCLEKLIQWLGGRGVSKNNFPILDPERPVYSLSNLYQIMMVCLQGPISM